MPRGKTRSKKKAIPKKSTVSAIPLIQFFKKIAKQKGLKQADIAKVNPELCSTSLVNHVFKGRRTGIADLNRVSNAMKFDKMERAQMKRAWTELKWGEPFSGGLETKKSLAERLDDYERYTHQIVEAIKAEEAIFKQNGAAEQIIKMVTDVTIPRINRTIEVLVMAQTELAKAKELVMRRAASLSAAEGQKNEDSLPSVDTSELDLVD